MNQKLENCVKWRKIKKITSKKMPKTAKLWKNRAKLVKLHKNIIKIGK